MPGRLLYFLMWITIASGMYMGLEASPPDALIGDSYRIFFFHLPFAVIAFFSFTLTAISGIMYLYTRNMRWDDAGISAAKLGFIFGGLALLTGWAFSYMAWGTKWSWDPKVVATMVMWFVYSGYIFLRSNEEDVSRRARLCAVYGIAGYVSVPLTYLSSRLVYSLHPESISLPSWLKVTVLIMAAGFFLLYFCLLWFNMSIEKLNRSLPL